MKWVDVEIADLSDSEELELKMAGKPAVEYWWYCKMCGRSSLYIKHCKRITHANSPAHEPASFGEAW